jgi:hypothetical protein
MSVYHVRTGATAAETAFGFRQLHEAATRGDSAVYHDASHLRIGTQRTIAEKLPNVNQLWSVAGEASLFARGLLVYA